MTLLRDAGRGWGRDRRGLALVCAVCWLAAAGMRAQQGVVGGGADTGRYPTHGDKTAVNGAPGLGGGSGGGAGMLDLPSSKRLGVVPGDPQRVNALPVSMAVSPDGRYVVTVNAGYGTAESGYAQSLAVMDTRTLRVEDFPDARTALEIEGGEQTLYSGLAFSGDGRHVYASMASLTDPAGTETGDVGNGVAVYGFAEGKIAPERMIPIGLQKLEGSRRTKLIGEVDGVEGVPYPAGIAVVGGANAKYGDSGPMVRNDGLSKGERLLVADNLSDDALLVMTATDKVVTRFDLSETDAVPGVYPVAVAASKDGARGFVALWNASEVVELDLKLGVVGRRLALLKPSNPVKPGSHPCALVLSPDGKTLYVALANRDAVAAVDISGGTPTHRDEAAMNGAPDPKAGLGRFALKGYFDTRLPGQMYFGAEPVGLAVSGDGKRLYAANMGSDAVAVIDTGRMKTGAGRAGMVEPVGFVPTEWMPMSLALVPTHRNKAAMNGTQSAGGAQPETLYVATDKGRGTGPNDLPQAEVPDMPSNLEKNRRVGFTYIATLLHGSLAAVDLGGLDLKAATAQVMVSNRMRAAAERVGFAGAANPIKHVIYVIKENRTYDQVFGDLRKDGRAVGNGDAGLAMYGEAVTPNQHKLALQFGVLDDFFDSGEVSGDGHEWSNAAISSDYNERVWPQEYRNAQRTYDFEGMVADGYPLLQKIADVNEPASGYLWGNADAHGRTHYNFGEFIATTFCVAQKKGGGQAGPSIEGAPCTRASVEPGEALPAEWGGGVNRFAWAIPLIAKNMATKPELVGHFAPDAPDFNLQVPDQIRMNVFERHFASWVADRAKGRDTMPAYITMRLPDDHTAGTTPGGPTPKASVADNDLAVGRLVDLVSHSAYWDDTAIFILEDDAQNGADHVDAHRSLALAVSKYAPRAAGGGTFVDSRFYTTVSVVRTMETLLGLPPMNNNDALAPLIGSEFAGPGDQAAFAADYRNRDNGLIYTANAKTAVGAKESMKMDFSHADRADASKLNVILWRDAMGDQAVPGQLTEKHKRAKKDDDDDE